MMKTWYDEWMAWALYTKLSIITWNTVLKFKKNEAYIKLEKSHKENRQFKFMRLEIQVFRRVIFYTSPTGNFACFVSASDKLTMARPIEAKEVWWFFWNEIMKINDDYLPILVFTCRRNFSKHWFLLSDLYLMQSMTILEKHVIFLEHLTLRMCCRQK